MMRRCDRQPGLHLAALEFCTTDLTNGFCSPMQQENCKCWDRAEATMQATGLSAQAVAWVYRNRKRIEDEAALRSAPATSPAEIHRAMLEVSTSARAVAEKCAGICNDLRRGVETGYGIRPAFHDDCERAIRAYAATLPAAPMKDKPCETCNDDPTVCATVPGLRHCEKATRGTSASPTDTEEGA